METTDHDDHRGIEAEIERVGETLQERTPFVAVYHGKVLRVIFNA
jgi:hypothetical protein